MRKYPQTQSVVRREPAREPNLTSDVLVALWQAIIIAGLATGIVALVSNEITNAVPSPKWLLVVFLVLTLLVYIGRSAFIASTLMKVEEMTDLDLNNDGQIGRPKHPIVLGGQGVAEPSEVLAPDPAGERLEQYLAACYRGPIKGKRPNSVRALRDAGFSDMEIEEYRDLLMQLGLAKWRDPARPQVGWRMTAPQDAALRRIRERIGWI